MLKRQFSLMRCWMKRTWPATLGLFVMYALMGNKDLAWGVVLGWMSTCLGVGAWIAFFERDQLDARVDQNGGEL